MLTERDAGAVKFLPQQAAFRTARKKINEATLHADSEQSHGSLVLTAASGRKHTWIVERSGGSWSDEVKLCSMLTESNAGAVGFSPQQTAFTIHGLQSD